MDTEEDPQKYVYLGLCFIGRSRGHSYIERLLTLLIITYSVCQDGWSSLMIASQKGHVEVVDKLLQHGATVDLQKEVHTLYVRNASKYVKMSKCK